MKVKHLRLVGWACIIASLAFQPSGWAVAATAMLAFLGGHLLGFANGKLDARDQLRAELRRGSKLL